MDAPAGATVAEVSIHPGEGTATLRYRESSATFADDGAFRPTVLMERASRYLAEQPGEVSFTRLRGDVKGKERGLARAVELLAREGFAEVSPGSRGATKYRHLRPYTEATDPKIQALNGSRPTPFSREPVVSEPGSQRT
jgi:hypothetical protein